MNEMTWKLAREDVASLYESLAGALSRANEAILSPDRDVPVGAEYREGFCDLRWDVEALTTRTERLLERLAESPAPDRLATAVDKIRAFGHTCVTVEVSVYRGKPYSRCNSHLPSPEINEGPWRGRPYTEWAAEVERGEASVHSDDVAAAAEARLEQIRELREQQRTAVVALVEALVEALSYREIVHFNPRREPFTAACAVDADRNGRFTDEPSGVTCPACREWVAKNVELSPEDIDALMAAIEEHDTRWNVWAKARDGGWDRVNSNLNEEQARAAVERRTRAAGEGGLPCLVFMALPNLQVPGQPPVDDSDRLVFLNPDPDVEVITGPTDAEEAQA